jgi:DNA-binding HxlR family transcriptional regulator
VANPQEEEKGIVNRKVIEGRPPRVEYGLTEKGRSIAKTLNDLNNSLLA